MTCREKLAIQSPECVKPTYIGGAISCPDKYGYLGEPDYCDPTKFTQCERCWDREIPGTLDIKIIEETGKNMMNGFLSGVTHKEEEPRNQVESPRIAYLCDRIACPVCSYPMCRHTTDITHAKNFVCSEDERYIETEDGR